jgi:hypothetical protein
LAALVKTHVPAASHVLGKDCVAATGDVHAASRTGVPARGSAEADEAVSAAARMMDR